MTDFVTWLADGGTMWVGIGFLGAGFILAGMVLILITKGGSHG